MNMKELKEVFKWMAITMILVVGGLGSRIANSADPAFVPQKPTAEVHGCKVTAEVKPAKEPYRVAVVVSVENPAKEVQRFDLGLSLVRRDFIGNPVSRVMSTDDFRNTVERTEKLHFAVAPSKTSVRTLYMPIGARPAKKLVIRKLSPPSSSTASANPAPRTADNAAPAGEVSDFQSILTPPPSYEIRTDEAKPIVLAVFDGSIAWPKNPDAK